jgi:phage regulator Rha-like protein
MTRQKNTPAAATAQGKTNELQNYYTERKIASSDFFTGSTYTDPTGRTLPCYLITKKGCEFVANKLTGRAFHRQEQQYYHAHLGPARYV